MVNQRLPASYVIQALTEPEHLFSRAQVLSSPTPVPAAAGIYAWYFREIPGDTPIDGCIARAGMRLLYIGISPKNESSRQNLRKRIRQHFSGNAEGSTLRKTLGVLLAAESGFPLRRVGSGRRRTFTHVGEQWLDGWMDDNALVCWAEHPRPEEVEPDIIQTVSLPLNIQDNQHHPFSAELSALRRRAGREANEAPVAPEVGQQR